MSVYNLPIQPTPFIGRTHELAQIVSLLDNPACRLLTLIGPGGMGKTRLMLEAASIVAAREDASFADGVYFVALQAVTSADSIICTVADALDLQFYAGSEQQQQLTDFFRAKTLLLLLDNFEHLLDGGVGFVSDLLAGAPYIKIVITSREILDLQEEWLFPVKGMHFPTDNANGDFEQYSAVQLFAQSASRARQDFSLDAERQAVLRICKLVGGMPLALEMTAAWLKRLPTDEIVRELERGLDILANPARNVPLRHQSMRVVFEHSLNLLSDTEREVFKKLAVFRGGFSRDAAEAVADASLVILSTLVDKSLLQMDTNGRYSLHELLRQYAEELLNASPETSQRVRELHARYYAGFMAQRAFAILVIRPGQAALAQAVEELENLRAAWYWAVEHRDRRLILKLKSPLGGVYHYLCMYQDGETLFANAAQNFRSGSDSILAELLSEQGWFAQSLAHYDEATALLEESLAIVRRRKRVWAIIFCLVRLSEIATQLGDYDRAWQFAEEALYYQQQADDDTTWVATFTFTNLGKIAGARGDFAEAKRRLKEAIASAQRFDVPVGIADARNYLGYMELRTQAYQDAAKTFLENLAFQKDLDYRRGEIVSLIGLGEAARGLGDYVEARSHFGDALRLALRLHEIPSALNALNALAELLIQEGDEASALDLFEYVQQHHATTYETRNRAQQKISELEGRLSLQVVGIAIARARARQIEQVADGVLNSQLIREPVSQPVARDNSSLSDEHFSQRELEILRLIESGLSNREIAEQLFLAIGTVKWHLNEIYGKLHVASRTQAIARAREMHLLN